MHPLPFFSKLYEKKDAFFLTTGFVFPFLLLSFRFYLWSNDFFIVFSPIYGRELYNRFSEPLLFCYIPAFLFFCLINGKKKEFYVNIYQKIPYFFRFFYILIKVELFLCRNLFLGFFIIVIFLSFYLFLLYLDSFWMHFRIPLISCYFSFSFFFRHSHLREYKSVLPHYPKFCKIQKGLKKEKNVRGGLILSLFYSLLIYVLYREDLVMAEYISAIEKNCNISLQIIYEELKENGTQNVKQIFQDLQDEKQNIFSGYKKKPYLYKAALFVFPLETPAFEIIYQKIMIFRRELFNGEIENFLKGVSKKR